MTRLDPGFHACDATLWRPRASTPGGAARDWARGGRDRHFAFREHRGKYEGFSAPVTACSIADGTYAPPVAVEALLADLKATRRTRRRAQQRETAIQGLPEKTCSNPVDVETAYGQLR